MDGGVTLLRTRGVRWSLVSVIPMPDQNTQLARQLAAEFKGHPEVAIIYAALRIEDAIKEATREIKLAIAGVKAQIASQES